jgi:hypothetical protein
MDRNPIFLTVTGDRAAELIANERHVLCPQYGACLDEAVIKNQHFICGACTFKMRNIKAPLHLEPPPCI